MPQIEVETNHHGLENDDIYMLCSDGLSDMLSGEQMMALFETHAQNIPLLCERLVEDDNNNAGRDKFYVILAKVKMTRMKQASGRRDRLVARLQKKIGKTSGMEKEG